MHTFTHQLGLHLCFSVAPMQQMLKSNQDTENTRDVVVPGTLRKNHFMLQIPHQPCEIGSVHILKVLKRLRLLQGVHL